MICVRVSLSVISSSADVSVKSWSRLTGISPVFLFNNTMCVSVWSVFVSDSASTASPLIYLRGYAWLLPPASVHTEGSMARPKALMFTTSEISNQCNMNYVQLFCSLGICMCGRQSVGYYHKKKNYWQQDVCWGEMMTQVKGLILQSITDSCSGRLCWISIRTEWLVSVITLQLHEIFSVVWWCWRCGGPLIEPLSEDVALGIHGRQPTL